MKPGIWIPKFLSGASDPQSDPVHLAMDQIFLTQRKARIGKSLARVRDPGQIPAILYLNFHFYITVDDNSFGVEDVTGELFLKGKKLKIPLAYSAYQEYSKLDIYEKIYKNHEIEIPDDPSPEFRREWVEARDVLTGFEKLGD